MNYVKYVNFAYFAGAIMFNLSMSNNFNDFMGMSGVALILWAFIVSFKI